MAFDLSKVLAAAEEIANSGQSSYDGPKLVYPGMGELKVRILFNPKSQSALRLVSRHKVSGKNLICASTYRQECPLCIGVQSYKDRTGSNMWTMDAKRLGLVLAQFVGTSRDYDNGGYALPEKGELICLMLPWSASKSLSDLIQRAGSRADEILTLYKGKVISIIKKQGTNIVDYKVEVDAFSDDFKSANNQEEFEEFLNNLPDLNEVYAPSKMPEDLLTKLQAEADSLLSKIDVAQKVDAGIPSEYGQVQSGTQPPKSEEAPKSSGSSQGREDQDKGEAQSTDCFGNFQNKNRECLMCDRAVDCAKEARQRKNS